MAYCSGNHERYVNYQKIVESITAHGVQILNDRTVYINGLCILGIEDRPDQAQAQNALDHLYATTEKDEGVFGILLYHQPDLWERAIHHGIDLMLAGHTHNGQIWPFVWLVRTRYQHVAGYFQSALSHLFVSQGTGTRGPIVRFGTRCEIAVIELRPDLL